jgi:hypothetical protein
MEFSESRLADRLVLGAIAHRVSNDNGEAFPSVATIAREANVSESSVHAALRALQQIGELEIDPAASRWGTNVYRLPKFMAWLESLHSQKLAMQGGAKSVPPGVQTPQHRGTQSAPEPSLNHQKNKELGRGAASSPYSSTNRKTPQQKRFAITARLASHAEELLKDDPKISHGDLADRLKTWAAQQGIPYFDAWPGAASPIQQAITIAMERSV